MNADEVYALLNKKIKKGGITDDQIRQIVEQYFKDNPVPTDKTLTIEDTPADAKATGDAINAIKDTVDNLNDILLDKFFSLQRKYMELKFRSQHQILHLCVKKQGIIKVLFAYRLRTQ